jgi:FkbM family methyltransferase
MFLPRTLTEDAGLLRIGRLPMPTKLWLVAMKYWFLAREGLGLPPQKRFRFRDRPFYCDSFIDAGFLLGHIAEMGASLEALGLLGKKGIVAVDVGAHHGETIIALDILLQQPTIYAFEPNPTCMAVLRNNVQGIQAELFQVGLGDRDGEAVFDLDHRFSSWHTFAFGGVKPRRSIDVRIARGDELIDLDHIDILKIDVEGYEGQVLEGLRDTLSRCSYVTIELSLERPKAYRFYELARLLGEQPFDLVRAGTLWQKPGGRPHALDLWFRNLNKTVA